MRKVSEANPQMAEYRWGTAELTHWQSTDGRPVAGLLFKPDDFDPSEKYPMMVYFYETNSDGLHSFRRPFGGGSSISVSFYVSRGYVVFIPDIHYRDGYPGESAFDCIVPGVQSVVAQGFIDSERIGVQGHSWGGYQIAYLVTKTDIFAAAEAGAPVSNMTSAYGGIRWASGLSRMMQYERTQSRIGGTLWDKLQLYMENSPLFSAPRVNTPLLMLHNDEDGAVPWYQGIEYFVALRRLQKPVWMLNYNGEAHGLRKYPNQKDWQQRMQQFFDHYLIDAPAPVWLEEGVPAVKKGRTLGLEYVSEQPDSTRRLIP
jgi:dipeptidyl aminopeptidase/acylaminoacyl peptidase